MARTPGRPQPLRRWPARDRCPVAGGRRGRPARRREQRARVWPARPGCGCGRTVGRRWRAAHRGADPPSRFRGECRRAAPRPAGCHPRRRSSPGRSTARPRRRRDGLQRQRRRRRGGYRGRAWRPPTGPPHRCRWGARCGRPSARFVDRGRSRGAHRLGRHRGRDGPQDQGRAWSPGLVRFRGDHR